MSIILMIALTLSVVRIIGIKSIAFQAIAHLFVGGLIGAACTSETSRRWVYLAVAVTLSVVETACFFYLG